MSDIETNIKEIRNLTIKGLIYGYSPLCIIGLIVPWLENLPSELRGLIAITSLVSFFYGYIICAKATERYAQYKGYKNYLYIYSILNVFGLSILFLLKNRNDRVNAKSEKEPLINFSISSIFISWNTIPLLFSPIFMLLALYIVGAQGFEEYYFKNPDFSAISDIPIRAVFVWYFIREYKRVNINYKLILGSLKKVDIKLAIKLTIAEYIFVWGINPITLYSLSFIFPEYVENQINKVYATTPLGWLCFAIAVLIFAPIMEELIYRGIILQKLTVKKDLIKAIVISAFAFAIMHFRFDIISLFITGVIYAILYLKTKQLAVPIISHFLYNLIVLVRELYNQLFSDVAPSIQITVAEYQQHFLEHWQWKVLYIALSAPYLCYFIYKNFPRNYDLNKLPYFANQQIYND